MAVLSHINFSGKILSPFFATKKTYFFEFSVGEEHRPVRLNKVVYGYECRIGWSSFRFDLQLTYRLKDILLKHSDGKPSLVYL